MKSSYKIFFLLSPLFLLFSSFNLANAAILSLVPEGRNFGIGQEFNIDIKINTDEEYINAAQATIKFPSNIIELKSADKTGSAFNFWVEEPLVSNDDGTLIFIGGTSKGISGESLGVLKLKFKARGAGSAEILISDAAITASDGKGTNVLSAVKGTNISIGTELIKPGSIISPSPSKSSSTQIEEQPQKVVRVAAPSKGLPQKPILRTQLYPDQTLWYNHTGDTVVFWEIPADVIEIATAIDKSSITKPLKSESELFTGKNFGILGEGVWYIHARFKNNIGWGETAHYKISIDTTAPLPFDIILNSPVSDNPNPEIQFDAQDSLSGISGTTIFVDDIEILKATSSIAKLPPQKPGKHLLKVRAFDLAGNSIESDISFEILPITAPIIEYFTKSVSQDELFFASGRSAPYGSVEMKAFGSANQEIFTGNFPSDESGNWKITLDKPLVTGRYSFFVVGKDERGAMSLPTNSEFFSVRPKTILSLGGLINLGWFEIFIILILFIISISSLIAWKISNRRKTHDAYKIIVSRDIEKLTTLLSDNLKELESLQELHDASRSAKSAVLINKMRNVIASIRKYISAEVNKLR